MEEITKKVYEIGFNELVKKLGLKGAYYSYETCRDGEGNMILKLTTEIRETIAE